MNEEKANNSFENFPSRTSRRRLRKKRSRNSSAFGSVSSREDKKEATKSLDEVFNSDGEEDANEESKADVAETQPQEKKTSRRRRRNRRKKSVNQSEENSEDPQSSVQSEIREKQTEEVKEPAERELDPEKIEEKEQELPPKEEEKEVLKEEEPEEEEPKKEEMKEKASEEPKEEEKESEESQSVESKATKEVLPEVKISTSAPLPVVSSESEEESKQVTQEAKEEPKEKKVEVLGPPLLKTITRDRAGVSGRRRPSFSRKRTPSSAPLVQDSQDTKDVKVSKESEEPSVLLQYLQAESARRQAMLMTKRTAEIRSRPRAFSLERPLASQNASLRRGMTSTGIGMSQMKAISVEAQNFRSWREFPKVAPSAAKPPRGPTDTIEKSLGQLDKERREVAKENRKIFLSAVKKRKEEVHVTRLIHCKGKNRVHVKLTQVSAKSLNKGDSFVLDLGSKIFCWHGSKASPKEKHKANTIGEIIKNHERNGSAMLRVLDEDTEEKDFWEPLGGMTEITQAAGDDIETEKEWTEAMKLYRGSLANEEIICVPVPSVPLRMESLQSSQCFLLDCDTEVFAWIGKEAPERMKKNFFAFAETFAARQKRPSWVTVSLVYEGGEPVLFREKFTNWPDLSHKISVDRMGLGKPKVHQISREYQPRLRANSFDVSQMVPLESKHEEGTVVTYEEKLEVWRIEGFKKVIVPKEKHGHFFSANCYILHYTHTLRKEGAIKNQMWVWQGKHCSKKEAGSGALQANEMINSLKRRVDVNNLGVIAQGKESKMFLHAFGNRMIVHKGRESDKDESKTCLYHITYSEGSHATETTLTVSSLNSKDAFLLKSPKKQFVWIGQGCFSKRKESATALSKHFQQDREHVEVEEGKEPPLFWELLGGKGHYANAAYLKKGGETLRWFWINQDEGFFAARETSQISQDELTNSKIAILDTFHEVFLWTGSSVSPSNKKKASEIVVEYLKLSKDKEDRPETAKVVAIVAGQEPLNFTCHFSAWESKVETSPLPPVTMNGNHLSPKPNGELKVTETTSPSPPVAEKIPKEDEMTFSLEVLRAKQVPKEVDLTRLESYLSEEDFQRVFAQSKEEFYKIPKWRQIRKRQEVGLF